MSTNQTVSLPAIRIEDFKGNANLVPLADAINDYGREELSSNLQGYSHEAVFILVDEKGHDLDSDYDTLEKYLGN